MPKISSPITKTDNVKFERELDTQIIISKYKNELNLDVSSYFQGLEKIQIYECLDTGYRFYYPFGLAGDAIFYEGLQKLQDYYPEWKWENEVAFSYIKRGDSVLEVGCGSGMFLNRLKTLGAHSVGLEFNDQAISECHRKGLNVHKQDIIEYSEASPEKYDVVCHFQVFEHIEKPQEFLSACVKALKPGGKLIMAVPNNNPYLYKNDLYHTLNLPPHHVGLWNKKSLKNLARFNKLAIEAIVVEPLDDWYYYYQINYASLRIPFRIFSWLRHLPSIIEGRNVIAILNKR